MRLPITRRLMAVRPSTATACPGSPVRLLVIAALFLAMTGCAIAPMSAELYILSHPDSIKRTASAIGKSFKDITPEQEYYIGRAVAATVLKQYTPYDNEQANHYLNQLGQSLAEASDRPETFGGYHFLILDSEEIKAFAAPGGLILVTRGMLRLCRSEDELAAVLAHEISHIENHHGLSAIQQSRIVAALGVLGSEGAKAFSGGQSALLGEAFEGAVGDIVSTLMHSSYSREQERQSDLSAAGLLRRVGYDPGALISVLREVSKYRTQSGSFLTKTHPDPTERIRLIEKNIGDFSAPLAPQERATRFSRFIAGV